ncbi:MAG: hypothetical protein HY909_08960 [Deltaproteobacteria bacterium]|nr:hypothetical protein [Deltaproteobacteria bacterium]
MTGPDALVAQLFAPARPCLARALALAQDHESPAQVYLQALAEGLVAPEPARCFAAPCAHCAGRVGTGATVACVGCDGQGWAAASMPHSVADAVAVLSLGGALAEAEGAAVACVRALQPFGAPAPTRLVLRVCAHLGPGPELLGVGLLAGLLEGALSVHGDASAVHVGDLAAAAVLGDLGPRPVTLRHQLANDCYLAALWGRACDEDWALPDLPEDPADRLLLSEEVRGQRFAALANPFEGLLRVWSLGLVLEDLGGDALVLAVPAVAGEGVG